MKDWEIIADRLSKAGWSLGWVSAIDSKGANDLDCERASRRWKAFHCVVIRTTADDGKAGDNLGTQTGTFTNQVCETDTGDCSNEVTVQVQ